MININIYLKIHLNYIGFEFYFLYFLILYIMNTPSPYGNNQGYYVQSSPNQGMPQYPGGYNQDTIEHLYNILIIERAPRFSILFI